MYYAVQKAGIGQTPVPVPICAINFSQMSYTNPPSNIHWKFVELLAGGYLTKYDYLTAPLDDPVVAGHPQIKFNTKPIAEFRVRPTIFR